MRKALISMCLTTLALGATAPVFAETAQADIDRGKELAFSRKDGNCLACHQMDDGSKKKDDASEKKDETNTEDDKKNTEDDEKKYQKVAVLKTNEALQTKDALQTNEALKNQNTIITRAKKLRLWYNF